MAERYIGHKRVNPEDASFRKRVLQQQKLAVQERLTSNPEFTAFEQQLGMYIEEIEPQVQSAVMSLYAKGYTTFSSGFYDLDPRYQTIEGMFSLEPETITSLQSLNVEVLEGYVTDTSTPPITILQFVPDVANLEEISSKWTDIVDQIPPKNKD